MDDSDREDGWHDELGHWLNLDARCFGDKGDVEDITEGQSIQCGDRTQGRS